MYLEFNEESVKTLFSVAEVEPLPGAPKAVTKVFGGCADNGSYQARAIRMPYDSFIKYVNEELARENNNIGIVRMHGPDYEALTKG